MPLICCPHFTVTEVSFKLELTWHEVPVEHEEQKKKQCKTLACGLLPGAFLALQPKAEVTSSARDSEVSS